MSDAKIRASFQTAHKSRCCFQVTIEDLVQIKPEDFDKPSGLAIQDAVNEKYANKVICTRVKQADSVSYQDLGCARSWPLHLYVGLE